MKPAVFLAVRCGTGKPPVMMRIFALTDTGRRLGEKLQRLLTAAGETAELSFKPQPFKQQVRDSFQRGERQILSALPVL